MTPKEILLEAASLARKHGVASGQFYVAQNGSMCINGLIGAAVKGAPIQDVNEYQATMNSAQMEPISNSIFNIIKQRLDYPERDSDYSQSNWAAAAMWNNRLDDKDRDTKVIEVLEQAAATF